MQPFLQSCDIIDWTHPAVRAKAHELASGCRTAEEVARNCFLFVRDRIRHSWDCQDQTLTCRASDVLLHGTGFCYAKSHLLAALCRANGIPAGLCYQRSVKDDGAPFCLHGLNAVYLENHGWYRMDARGNKPGVEANFCPPLERLAFPAKLAGEAELPEIWPEPLPVVVRTLQAHPSVQEFVCHLPDIALWQCHADASLQPVAQ